MKKHTGAARKLALLSGVASIAATGALLASVSAQAAEIDIGVPDIKIRWDNTIKYSAGIRVEDQDDDVLANVNADDGDRAFDKWDLISNRVDLLSEFDLSNADETLGIHVSAAAWYDTVYNSKNANNDGRSTFNGSLSQPTNEFTDGTQTLHGGKVELLDGFAYGSGSLGGHNFSVRVGQYTLLWGESLLVAYNGIANGQAPLDYIKGASVPSSTAKELFMPVPQVSGIFQISPGLSFAAYYQFQWRKTRAPGVGSYFSNSDYFDAGGTVLFPAPGLATSRIDDLDGDDDNQYGGSIRWTPTGSDFDLGLYAIRYNAKTPTAYIRTIPFMPPVVPILPTEYQMVFPNDIKAYGASLSTSLLDANVAVEVSVRQDTPLISLGSMVLPGQLADNDDNFLYPTGNSFHAQASVIRTFLAPDFWDSANLAAEVAMDSLINIERNRVNFDASGRTQQAATLAVQFTPSYYSVLPSLDIDVPITLHWNFAGKSSVSAAMTEGSSDISIGINGTYESVWRFGINYTHYLGEKPGIEDPSLGQAFYDRDFVSFNIQRTF